MGSALGLLVGGCDAVMVGTELGTSLISLGSNDGKVLGCKLGLSLGRWLGNRLGGRLGLSDGPKLGEPEG